MESGSSTSIRAASSPSKAGAWLGRRTTSNTLQDVLSPSTSLGKEALSLLRTYTQNLFFTMVSDTVITALRSIYREVSFFLLEAWRSVTVIVHSVRGREALSYAESIVGNLFVAVSGKACSPHLGLYSKRCVLCRRTEKDGFLEPSTTIRHFSANVLLA